MVSGKQGTFPVRHLAQKILMAVNNCGLQLAQGLGWAAPVYHKQEGATPHPGTRKFGLQYDGRPDGYVLGRGI